MCLFKGQPCDLKTSAFKTVAHVVFFHYLETVERKLHLTKIKKIKKRLPNRGSSTCMRRDFKSLLKDVLVMSEVKFCAFCCFNDAKQMPPNIRTHALRFLSCATMWTFCTKPQSNYKYLTFCLNIGQGIETKKNEGTVKELLLHVLLPNTTVEWGVEFSLSGSHVSPLFLQAVYPLFDRLKKIQR